jgi:hypothetical protein
MDLVFVEDMRCILFGQRTHVAVENLISNFLGFKLKECARILIIFKNFIIGFFEMVLGVIICYTTSTRIALISM